jgi:hypothetical protein
MKLPALFRSICTLLVAAALSAALGSPACAAELNPGVNGQNVAKVVCKNGPEVFTFSKVGPLVWMKGEGDIYKEESRDEWSVHLVRTKRGKGGDAEGMIKAQIDIYTKKVSIFRQAGTVEFTIISASKRKK